MTGLATRPAEAAAVAIPDGGGSSAAAASATREGRRVEGSEDVRHGIVAGANATDEGSSKALRRYVAFML